MLGGCVSVPQPFRHGTQAAQAPTARLAVPVSTASGTDQAGAQGWQRAMVNALLAQSVPAMGQPVRPGDWWLKMTADARNGAIVPTYAVITPKGEERGHMDGAPVPVGQWQAGDGQAVSRAAQEAAPGVAELLTGIQAAQMQKDPNSLKNRPAHVYFAGVQGAPGDGDRALARAFIAAFPDAHEDIRHTATGADYTVRCTVVLNDAVTTTSTTKQQHIVLTWQVLDEQGKEAGAATQIHDIAAHSLDAKWGDVAVAAADEAAGAARQIITRYSGRANVPLAADGVLPAQSASTAARPVAASTAASSVMAGGGNAAVPVTKSVVPTAPSAPVAAHAASAPAVASVSPVSPTPSPVVTEHVPAASRPMVAPAAPVSAAAVSPAAPPAVPVAAPVVHAPAPVSVAQPRAVAVSRPTAPATQKADRWPPMPRAAPAENPAPTEITGKPVPLTPPAPARPFPGVTLPPRRPV
ncbi:hypothetical protein CFR76_07785 [Komagataeibacter swingsii]|uniref:Uncharacterized protein n=2 Tax=Komagataeibacter swingsii TaxID=215220 RepID=A0A2V4RMU8_9PROT|nr:hypothetical protein CFR76_07785 [Komagataeibacter swingsii]GBQ61281.1 hypothetical protein AA16373_2154 [Komagataeibacter swingsii DSM 16373]